MKMRIPLLWLLKRIRNRIPALILMTVVHVGQAALGVCFALGIRRVIDCAVAGESAMFYRACIWQGMIIVGILACQVLFNHLKERLSADLDRDWKRSLLHGLLHGEYMQVSGYHSAELLNRMNNDVKTVDDGILTILPNVSAMVTRLAAAAAVLMALDPVFTVLIVVLGGVMFLATSLLRKQLKSLHKKVSEQDGVVSGLLQETMEKLLLVQAMDVTNEVERRADTVLDKRYQMQRKRKNVSILANAGVSIMSYGAGFLALVWCACHVLEGTMSFGTLTAVTNLVSQLQSPFVGLSGIIPRYIAMAASAERLMELENIQAEPVFSEKNGSELYEKMTSLVGKNLCFTYDRDAILQNADFELPKGTFAVVTGASGMGKSTLLKLLLGIFRPDSGALLAQCEDISIPLDRSTRKLFAYVPQGNLLFSGSLRENLTLIKPDATEAELQQALYVSAMDEYLPELPQGLDTCLGENGAGLSEGQAQRLAIARAVLGGAPVLLLDECTSALDMQTEKTVLRRLSQLENRTCLAVTHRPAAMEMCDWQLEISHGAILQRKIEK